MSIGVLRCKIFYFSSRENSFSRGCFCFWRPPLFLHSRLKIHEMRLFAFETPKKPPFSGGPSQNRTKLRPCQKNAVRRKRAAKTGFFRVSQAKNGPKPIFHCIRVTAGNPFTGTFSVQSGLFCLILRVFTLSGRATGRQG